MPRPKRTRSAPSQSSQPGKSHHKYLPQYFKKTSFHDWSLLGYLRNVWHTTPSTFAKDCRRWIHSLRSIADCNDLHCCHKDKVARAKHLLASYDMDKKTAKERIARKESEQNAGGGPLMMGAPVVANCGTMNFHNSVFSTSAQVGGVSNQRSSPTVHPEEPSSQPHSDSGSDIGVSSSSAAYATFADLYASMTPESKWKLSTGRYVEDVIRDAFDTLPMNQFEESLLSSFILDLSDHAMTGFFSKAEMEELKGQLPAQPKANVGLANYIQPFLKAKTTSELTAVFATRPTGEDPGPWCSWVDFVVHSTCNLLRSPNNLLNMPQSEDWYSMHVWTPVIHTAFFPVQSIVLVPGELVCRASSLLLNQDRSRTSGPENRQKLGPRMDGIIRSVHHDHLEFGAIEAGKKFDGTGATKWIEDGNKLRRVLRDMLLRLHDEVDEDSVKRVQTVGIITGGLRFQLLRCWAMKKGGVVLCENLGPVREYPKNVHKLHKCLWHLVQAVDTAIRIVQETSDVVENEHSTITVDELLAGGGS